MSYILDALRKADAERSRGAVPGLASQPLPAALPAGESARLLPPSRAWMALGGVAAVTLAAVAWWAVGSLQRAPGPPARGAPVPGQAPLVSTLPGQAPLANTLPGQAPPVSTVPAVPTALAISVPPARPAPAAGFVPSASAALGPQVAVPAPQSPALPAAVSAAAGLPALADLPEAVRRQLPPLKVGGSVWSEQPASRFILVDGQLLREGEAVAPGLVLERIGPKRAQLRWREQRFELAY